MEENDMTLNEYQELARRTQNKELTREQRMLHSLHGMAGEVGEIHAIYQKWYQGHPVLTGDVVNELGDLLWFAGQLCDCLGMTLGQVAAQNIEKLKKRYPQGFSEERSRNRDE